VEHVPDFEPPDGFRPPIWLGKGERRHIPEPDWTLERIMENSKGREGDAWYHPQLPIVEIRQIEMGTLRDMYEIEGKRKNHQRVYCRGLGREIGVSKGQLTEYVYVFYSQSGGVHGLPITLDELKRKGARI
jgi:hypothetical protein